MKMNLTRPITTGRLLLTIERRRLFVLFVLVGHCGCSLCGLFCVWSCIVSLLVVVFGGSCQALRSHWQGQEIGSLCFSLFCYKALSVTVFFTLCLGVINKLCPASILDKSTAGRYRPITARYRFIKNANWVFCDCDTSWTFLNYFATDQAVTTEYLHNTWIGTLRTHPLLHPCCKQWNSNTHRSRCTTLNKASQWLKQN